MDAGSTILAPSSWTRALPIEDIFPRDRPLEVDIGCGKGRFLLARAARYPQTHFLGIDRLLRRLRRIDKKAHCLGLTNVRLLRIEAAYAVAFLLPPLSVTAFYVFFPDPWPKRRHHRRRLFSPAFLDALHRTLREGGCVHAATDHADYFEDIRRLFAADPRFEEAATFEPVEEERTDFELIFLTQEASIGRCSFRKRVHADDNGAPPPSPSPGTA